jgi:hypothetical protein
MSKANRLDLGHIVLPNTTMRDEFIKRFTAAFNERYGASPAGSNEAQIHIEVMDIPKRQQKRYDKKARLWIKGYLTAIGFLEAQFVGRSRSTRMTFAQLLTELKIIEMECKDNDADVTKLRVEIRSEFLDEVGPVGHIIRVGVDSDLVTIVTV